MLQSIKFTRYQEHHTDFTVQLTLNAEYEGQKFEAVSHEIAQSKAVDSLLDKTFRVLVEQIVDDILKVATETGKNELNLHGMNMMDKLALFYIRQTVGFTNDVHKSCRNVNVILLGIW
jgi:hypothetical protein